ncbi:MAG: flagellar hook-length control protein FliK [Gammaproteobacteria bacterium]
MSNVNSSVSAPPAPDIALDVQSGKGPVATHSSSRSDSGPAHADESRKPFADLLSSVLQGTQPNPTAPGTDDLDDAHATSDTPAADPAASGTTINPLAGLAGTAAPEGMANTEPAANSTQANGNASPGSGKNLPLPKSDSDTAETAAAKSTSPASAALSAEVAHARSLAQSSAQSLSQSVDTATNQAADAWRTAGAVSSKSGDKAGDRPVARSSASPPALTSVLATRDPARFATAESPVLPDNYGITSNTGLAGSSPTLDEATASSESELRLVAADLRQPNPAGNNSAGADASGRVVAAFAAGSGFGAGSRDSAATGTAALTGGTGGLTSGSLSTQPALQSPLQPLLQPLGSAGAFASGLADRLMTLSGPGSWSARLKLHPEHLGELKVDIRIGDGSAEVWFGAANDQARHAIQASLPHLRDLFAEQGINLMRTHVDTGDGSPAQQFTQGQGMAHDQTPSGDGQQWGRNPASGQLDPSASSPTQAMHRTSRSRLMRGGWHLAGAVPSMGGLSQGHIDVRV